jgi:hypothetical protein
MTSNAKKNSPNGDHKLRPVLYIGLGGVGVQTIVQIKTSLERLGTPMGGFGFIGLDTKRDKPAELDNTQYMAMSIGADPQSIAAGNRPYLQFYEEARGHYAAKSIAGGANQVRLVGRVAFRNPPTLASFKQNLEAILDRIKSPQDGFSAGVPAVCVISSVAGGTGSGCLQDVLACTGHVASGVLGADFFYQAVLVLPDALEGEADQTEMPHIYANAYATLRDLYHFLTSGEEKWEDYGKELGRIKLDRTLLPSIVYLVGDKNEEGTPLFAKIDELSEVVSQFLLSDVLCPNQEAGGVDKRRAENSHALGSGNQGMPRVFASFGHLRAGLLREPLGEYLGARLVRDVLQVECSEGGLAFQEAAAWISTNHLAERGADQLQDAFKQASGYDRGLFVGIDSVGHLLTGKVDYKKLKEDCDKFQDEVSKRADITEWEGKLQKAIKIIAEELKAKMEAAGDERKKQFGAGTAAAFVSQLKQQLRQHEEALQQEAADKKKEVAKLRAYVQQSVKDIDEARKSWWSRREKLATLLSDFGTRLQTLLSLEAEHKIINAGLEIYKTLASAIQSQEQEAVAMKDNLAERLSAMERRCVEAGQTLNSLYDVSKRGAGNQLSLVDGKGAEKIYKNQIEQQKASAYSTCRESLQNANLLDSREPFEAWAKKAIDKARGVVVDTVLDKVDFANYLENYLDSKARAERLGQIKALATPLFWLDPNTRESGYPGSWLIGVAPEIRPKWEELFAAHLGSDTRDFTSYESRGDMALYKITMGYTLHSLKSLGNYRSHYWRMAESFRKETWMGKVAEPVDVWPEARDWEEPVPLQTGMKDAAKYFALGRALNNLVPNDTKPGKGFIYTEQGKYFVNVAVGGNLKKTDIGANLPQALAQFSESQTWQKAVKDEVDAALAADVNLISRLETDFLQKLDDQITALKGDQSEKAFDDAEALRTLKTALLDFLKESHAALIKVV